MVGKKTLSNLILILLVVLITSMFSGCGSSSVQNSSKKTGDGKQISIGISQIVEHPALDSARKGFIDALASKGFKDGEKIKIDFQSAQGDIPTAQTIAQNFVSQKKDLILAIATPAAQAAFNATKDIPILITAVTDPVKAGLVKSVDKTGTNVTGTSDYFAVENQFELIKKFVPDAKNIGVLYNTSETNSEIQVDEAKKASKKFGFNIIAAGISSTNEVSQAVDSLTSKVDAFYIPTDNMVASSLSLISSKCIEKKIPIIGAEKGQVESGALATTGIDYYKLGFQTGLMAVDVINGKSPSDMCISTSKDTSLFVNTDTANKLGIDIPSDIKSKMTEIKGGGK